MTYEDILSVLSIPEINIYARDGISHSFPIPGRYNGNVVDCFFLYSQSSSDKKTANGPLSLIIADSYEKKLIAYQETIPQKLCNSLSCEDAAFWKAYEDYESLYPVVRSFVFSKSINTAQKRMLGSFIKTLRILINDTYYATYRRLFAEFFNWTENHLSKVTEET